MEEIWKDIVGYEGLYQVSNYGEIKSLYNYKGGNNILKQRIKKGYYTIGLRKNGKRKWCGVHILVANAFLDKEDYKSMPNEDRNLVNINKLDVNHKDEDKLNNRYDNLEFCTRLYNNCYGSRLEKVSKSNKLKKNVKQYDLDGNFIKEYVSISEASKQTGTDKAGISNCINNKQKTAGGYIWKYESVVMPDDQ